MEFCEKRQFKGIFELASNETQALYKLMEKSFKPNFRVKIAEVELGKIVEKKCHDQYVESLRNAFATKALNQISLIYESLSKAAFDQGKH
ncbi:unnamed protein product, partial [Mesorhabditis belari]|uniref:Uncharacterized protein n=1 Tax=Mesorhabditis belari TaxID=2138241 RepID=A0AAF3EGU7_9BILA